MKSFASLILAAVVSAEYCYEDGCNCNGEARACYSVPRQNMKPKAINTCCPAGDQPTIYGRDNGRSVNIEQTVSLTNINTNPAFFGTSSGNSIRAKLVESCAETFQAWNCSDVHYSYRKTCEKGRSDNRKVCEQNAADERAEAEKAAADERKEAEKAAADERKEAEKAAADERVVESLMTMTGTSSATWSPTASLAWNADKCSSYCASFGTYPPTKCERYGPCEAQEEAAPEVTASLNWTNTRCRDYCQTTGAYPPMGCGQMTSPMSPYAEPCAPLAATTNLLSQQKKDYMTQQKSTLNRIEANLETPLVDIYAGVGVPKWIPAPKASVVVASSLKKNGNWNNNEFTGANVETGGNTNCIKGCGIEVNLNGL